MAKKKNSQFLPGVLEDIMSLLTPEEQEIAFELFNDGANQVDEELSHIYYHHRCSRKELTPVLAANGIIHLIDSRY